jgi:hypothetical protein
MTCVLFDRQLCATFLVEDPDIETMKRELKDAFRFHFLNFLYSNISRRERTLH